MLIYKITNKVNGKVYVGKTTFSLQRRWHAHIHDAERGSRRYFCRAIRKYGKDNFDVTTVVDGITDIDVLNTLERKYIAQFQSHVCTKGYNRTMGGDGNTMSVEARAEHSLRLKGRFTGKKNPFFGKKHTKATRDAMKQSWESRPRVVPDEIVRKRADTLKRNGSNKGDKHHMFGKRWDAKHMKIFRAKSSGKNNAMYGRTGEMAPGFNRPVSAETSEKLRAAKESYWATKHAENTPSPIEGRKQRLLKFLHKRKWAMPQDVSFSAGSHANDMRMWLDGKLKCLSIRASRIEDVICGSVKFKYDLSLNVDRRQKIWS